MPTKSQKVLKNLRRTLDEPKSVTVKHSGRYITAKDGTSFPVYYKGIARYYVDIPLGANKIGIVYNKYFIPLFLSHPDTIDTIRKLEIIGRDHDGVQIASKCEKMIEQSTKLIASLLAQ
jgi:hypothetical protein